MVLCSFSGWIQTVQLPVFRQIKPISQPCQKEFGKPKVEAVQAGDY